MFKFLATIGGKPPHPLTNVEAVTRWMDDLPVGDSVKVIEALTQQIKEYIDQQQTVTHERLAVLKALDQGAQTVLSVLCKQYLQNPRMSKLIESRLWNTVNSYLYEILRAYHSLLMEYIADPKNSKISAAIPLLTARTLWYFGRDAKWSYYRYAQPDPKLWKRMHNLYGFSVHEKFETSSMKLYDEDVNETSIEQLYLQSLMLETLNTGSLTPRQLNLIERWLPMLLNRTHLASTHHSERHAFYVNLEENRGARRIKQIQPSAALRFWGTFEVQEKLDDLRSQLTAGAIPAKLGLTEDCRLPSCLELLERIAYLWAPIGLPQTQRAFERKHCVKPIEVVRGLSDICWNVRADNVRAQQAKKAKTADGLSYDAMVDVHLYGFITQRTHDKIGQSKDEKIEQAITHEHWVMENESQGGYGAHITDQADDWIRLGKLVGLKPAQKDYWNIGVVRRMLHTEPTQLYIGIEVIVEHPVALLLRAEKSEERPLSVDGIDTQDVKIPFPALFLKGGGQFAKTDAVILHSAEFASGRELWFSIRGTTYHIRLKHVLEQGDDWLRASFEVLGKDTPNTHK